jgi:hypothetical protein
MGEQTGGLLQVAGPEDGLVDSRAQVASPGAATGPSASPSRSEIDAGRRRFTFAALIAIALTAVPFIWILWVLWGPVNPARPSNYQDNFYDLQARAMFHGHLSLANGALGIEGFLHDGRTYTYFGLFPSIIRMPVLLVTNSLDGKLTPTYTLLAWLLTGLFTSLLLWRVRFFIRGESAMGRVEAGAFGVLIATIMGGTIWMLLAETPFVFNEDIAWSICLTVGSIFALLGVIERPSWGRVIVSAVLILCANLDRATTGWACAVGAGLIAVWFLFGRGGPDNRRWFGPVLGAGIVPLAIGCAVNYSKFGVLFGVSNFDQVWTHVNAYRRKFLAANHNAEEGTIFVRTNLLTYFRPDGLRLSSVFPFVTLPASPPSALGGVLFDRLYRTASLTASSPLLVLLSLWGLVTAFRPKALGQVSKTRLLLLAAGSAGAALMLWGYIAPRYLGDFVPLLVLASAVALADIFRRVEGRKRTLRIGAVAGITVLALFSITANVGMAVVPTEEWDTSQVLGYVQAQKTISDFTGHPLEGSVSRGSSLPIWAPAGRLFVIGNCNGLYISNGEKYYTVPSQQYTRTTWMTVELGHAFQHTFRMRVEEPKSSGIQTAAIVHAGAYTVTVSATPSTAAHLVGVNFAVRGGEGAARGYSFTLKAGSTHTVVVTTDPVKHLLDVSMDGLTRFSRMLRNEEPVRVDPSTTRQNESGGALTVTDVTSGTAQPTLCRSLIH